MNVTGEGINILPNAADEAEGGNWHPDWHQIMKDCGGADKRANDLVMVTRETARLAASALRQQNGADAYHNFMAAERELLGVLED